MSDSGEKQAQLDNYFLPDLCRGQGLLGLLLTAGLLAVFMTLVRSGISAFDFLFLAQVAVDIFFIALLSAVFICQGRRFLINLPLPQIALINFFLVVAAAAICTALMELWQNYLLNGLWQVDYLLILNTMLITAILAGAILRLFYLQHQLRQQQGASQQARIEALQSKIRPHFLFNSMNSLASLIRTDPDKAEQTLENLCDLFRYALNNGSQGVSLQLEVDSCKKYLQVEKLRLAERLKYHWDIAIDLASISVPALILQPLIENAVFHGIQPALEGGYLKCSIYRDGEWICIEIENSLEADTAQQLKKPTGHNMAVNNLRHRMDVFFNHRAELQETVQDNHYHTRIRFKPTEG